MRSRLINGAAVLAVLALAVLSQAAFAQTELLQNGSFSNGLAGWTVNPNLSPWSPLASNTSNQYVSLHPPGLSWVGTVLYQNLNVTGVAGKTVDISMAFQKTDAWAADVVGVYLEYVDTSGAHRQERVLTSGDPQTADWQTRTAQYTLPADARKLVRLAIAKEDYGSYAGDNVSLTATGVTVNPVPEITAISPDSGPYPTTCTITGSGFGSNQGRVEIGGESSGVTVQSWTDRQIVVQVNEPARSGAVRIYADETESNGLFTYTVTSPYFTVDFVTPTVKVIKGETAQMPVRVDFFNGFATQDGVSLFVPEAPSICSFAPLPLKGAAGTLLSIDTSSLAPGDYEWHVQSVEAHSYARMATFRLRVVTVSDIRFFGYDSSYTQQEYSSLTVSKQGSVSLNVTAIDSDGKEVSYQTPITLVSSDPQKFGAYPNSWNGYDCYARNNGSVTLTATTPDGHSETLPVTITFPETPRIVSVSVIPPVVTNKGDVDLSYYAKGTDWIGVSAMGELPLPSNGTFSDGNTVYTGTARVAEGAAPGTYLFSAYLGSDGSVTMPTPVTITNDPSRGAIRCGVFPLDPPSAPEVVGTLELYNQQGELVKSFLPMSQGHSSFFTVHYVQPGTYRAKFVPFESTIYPQWYPNADSFAAAADVVVSAGQTADAVYFFTRNMPAQPPVVTSPYPAPGAVGVPVSAQLSATFSVEMDTATLDATTFTLADAHGAPVTGTVQAYGNYASFIPTSPLLPGQTYTAKISGSVKSAAQLAMGTDYVWSFTTLGNDLKGVRQLPDGASVELSDKWVYLVGTGFGYVEDTSRACGIRVEGTIPSAAGPVIGITGTKYSTSAGEPYISVGNYTVSGNATMLPLTSVIQTLCSPEMAGLYVCAEGRVQPNPSSAVFAICDGSLKDGADMTLTVKPLGFVSVQEGETVIVTGAAGYENGQRVIHALTVTPVTGP